MAEKRTIAIDIDNVLADINEPIRLWANAKTSRALTEEHYRMPGDYWGYNERVWAEHGLVLNFEDFEADLAADSIEVPLLAGASFAIKELTKNYKVVLITSRPVSLQTTTEHWIATHFADSDLDLYFAGSKIHTHPKSKGQVCKELGAFLLIDDNVDHCQSVLDEGLEAILFGEYGWQHSAPSGMVRCNDWPSVLEYLDGQ